MSNSDSKSELTRSKVRPIEFDGDTPFDIRQEWFSNSISILNFEILDAALQDPCSLAERSRIRQTEKSKRKIIEEFAKRRDELGKKTLEILTKEEFPPRIHHHHFRGSPPQPPPPPDRTIGAIGSFSINDALESINVLPSKVIDIPCTSEQGNITIPNYFNVHRDTSNAPSDSAGSITYSIDDASLPFRIHVPDASGEAWYFLTAELGYVFPRPRCESIITWELRIGAFVELYGISDDRAVFLDKYVTMWPNMEIPAEHQKVYVLGDLLRLTDMDTHYAGVSPMTLSGNLRVQSQKESSLWLLMNVALKVSSGSAFTQGHFHIGHLSVFSGEPPGIRYRMDPILAP